MTLGSLAVLAGTIGIFLPILPTTPFLLLAAYCYVRSSLPLYRMLMNNRFFGSLLRNYLEGKGMSLAYKAITLTLLWLVLGLTAFLFTPLTVVRIILGVVAVGVSIHILTLKTVSRLADRTKKEVSPPG
ncbi:MAG TPA: YbaN family protein [Dehalococcoidales bacterium]|nr:YbaN family protein [Dehalococcoidales bacterium]